MPVLEFQIPFPEQLCGHIRGDSVKLHESPM